MEEDNRPFAIDVNWKYAMVAWEATFPIMKFDDKGKAALLIPRLKYREPAVQNKDVGRESSAPYTDPFYGELL